MISSATAILRALAATALLAAAAAAGALSLRATPVSWSDGMWRLRGPEGWLYRFHGSFRVEALFDLLEDPNETRDLARERPDLLARERGRFLARLGYRSLEEIAVDDPAFVQRMKGLGYR